VSVVSLASPFSLSAIEFADVRNKYFVASLLFDNVDNSNVIGFIKETHFLLRVSSERT